jgi:hypothetical protein
MWTLKTLYIILSPLQAGLNRQLDNGGQRRGETQAHGLHYYGRSAVGLQDTAQQP